MISLISKAVMSWIKSLCIGNGLLTQLLAASPFSAVRASLRWWSNAEFEDGLTHAGKVGCRGGPLIHFFPPCGFEPAILGTPGRHLGCGPGAK